MMLFCATKPKEDKHINLKFVIDLVGVSAEMLMLAYFYTHILGRSKVHRLVEVGVYGTTGLLFLVISTLPITSSIRTPLALLLTFLPMTIYHSKWLIKILSGAIYLAVQATVEMMVKALLLGILGSIVVFTEDFLQNYFLGVLLSKVMAFLVIYTMVSFLKICAGSLSLLQFLLLMTTPLATILAIAQLIAANYLLDTQANYFMMAVTTTFLVGASMASFYLFNEIREVTWLKARLTIGQDQVEQQQRQYNKLVQYQQEIRKMDHDMNHRLEIIIGYLLQNNQVEAIDYAQKLKLKITSKHLTITGYCALDIALSDFKEQLQQHRITLIDSIHLQDNLIIPDTDLAIMLVNCLDNALEAVEQIADPALRRIELSIYNDDVYLYMMICNPVAQPVVIHNGHIATTKSDQLAHGMGLDNVRQLAEVHHGHLVLACEKQIFSVSMMIKLSDCA